VYVAGALLAGCRQQALGEFGRIILPRRIEGPQLCRDVGWRCCHALTLASKRSASESADSAG